MKFSGVCIVTENVLRLSDFYQKVLKAAAEGNDTHMAIKVNGMELTIISEKGMEDLAAGSVKYTGNSSSVLMFEVEDADCEYERLKAMNIEFIRLPTTFPWGNWAFWFKDPDGNIVDFYAKVKN